ncbi:MAG: hypothetical protein ACRCYA_03070 [Cetobacterium sp.]|uniref:hypothetical protein n=1 Tax=Cetobacterium sp. TaxID=2071632 RepID=UPI003F3040AB
MKKIVIGIFVLVAFAGCEESVSSNELERRKQEELSKQAMLAVDLPNISNFYEKKTLKKILEMRDNPKIINYLYTKNDMSGKWVYEGKCIGFGIPYSTQYTNPEMYKYSGTTLPQADPNGLYSTPNGTATWVIKVDDNGLQTVEYIESEIRVTQNKLARRLVETWSLTQDY